MKTVIITGASKGIGRKTAEILAKDGYKVIANYNKSEEEAMQLKKELIEQGIEIDLIKADVSKKEECEKIVEYTIQKYSKIDVLINNAGISNYGIFTDIKEIEIDKIMKTNLYSAMYMCQEVGKYMIREKRGCIINISSIWGVVGASCEVAYSVSKAGVDGLTKSLAKEWGPSNIRVNSIAPGIIKSEMNSRLSQDEENMIKKEIPLEKIGKPEDITKAIKWLIEDDYTTGQVISPNGGWVI